MSNTKIAVVTGGNKGIGYAVVKALCEKFDGIVYLTARDSKRGEEALNKLKESGLKPHFYQLDIDSEDSCAHFRDYLKEHYGGLDLLINNAGMAFKMDANEPFALQAELTVRTNYFGTLRVSKYLLPLMRENGRVINVSSSSGHLSKIPGAELKAKLSSPELGYEELNILMNQFIESAKDGRNVELGWGTSAYVVSKVGVSALTRIQQRFADKEKPNRNLLINCCHPGYVATDMTSYKAHLTIDEGARSTLFLSLEDHGLKGKYVWKDSTEIDWLADNLPEPF